MILPRLEFFRPLSHSARSIMPPIVHPLSSNSVNALFTGANTIYEVSIELPIVNSLQTTHL